MIKTTIPAAIAAALLTGCTTTIESTSGRLDSAEDAIRLGRVHYQERLDRISLEWICSGMSWSGLVTLTGGDQILIAAIMRACAAQAFPVTK